MSGSFFGSYFRRMHKEAAAHEMDEGGRMENEGEIHHPPHNTDLASEAAAPTRAAQPPPPPASVPETGDRKFDEPPSPVRHPPSTPSISEPAAESPLDGLMRDKIVVALLQQDIITVPQALLALQRQKRLPGKALWRLAAEMSDVDSDAVYARAAELQGFKIAHFTPGKPSDELIDAVQGLFAPQITARMQELGILPYDFVMHPDETNNTLVFVTHDPGNPDVAAFSESLGVDVEMRFASASLISDRIRRMLNRANSGQVETRVARAEDRHEAAQSRMNGAERNGASKQQEVSRQEEEQEELSAAADHSDIEFIDVTDTITPDELRKLLGSDALPEDEVLVDEAVDRSNVSPYSGDGISGHDDASDLDAPESAQDVPDDMHSHTVPPTTDHQPPTAHENIPPAVAEPAPEELEPEDEAPALEPANLDAIKSKDRVVATLLKKSAIKPEHVSRAQHRQKKEGSKEALWRLIAQEKGVDRDAIFMEAARVYAFPIAKLGEGQPDADFARSVIETFSEEKREELFRLKILPYECDLEHQTGAIKLVFITHDPTRPEVNRLMQQLRLERFELRYAPEAVVTRGLGEAFPKRNKYLERVQEGSGAIDLGTTYEDKAGTIDEDALEAEINRSTLINLFEATLVEAVRQGASDVHIFPNAQRKTEIHFRVDGRLGHWHTEDKVHPEALLAVIKDNSINVDRFERDAAQDGFIQRWIDEALIRFRVSVLPIANASQEIRSESIVIRVLDDRAVITDLGRLGLLKGALERFDSAIRQPHGMVILTGPTGSGKSTTLVAALHQVVTPEVNVLTVEDPVEYIIPGVRQIKLNHKLGLEAALRSILRHDPDIVMVGEMRDRETAELAIKLANTGHLTFSTLHTNDAPAAISRLYKMGVEPFLIAYAINLVVAQRLIRNLCPTCKKVENDPDDIMLEKLGFTNEDIKTTTFYVPGNDQNCKTCNGTGYKGRRAVCEALYFSRTIRHMIVEASHAIDEEAIRDQARKEGMLSLADSAREIVKMGETSVREMIRVVTTEG